jgi:glycosyltransferase involved in cell wall biosynthesis
MDYVPDLEMLGESPLVSIGVPTFNRPKGLQKAISAILRQSYKNIEIIVSDNCSPTKETSEVVARFLKEDSRVKYFTQPENQGILNNFYFVLRQAKGNYFMWAADDDEWQGNDFLETLIKYAPANILTFPDALIKKVHGDLGSLLKNYENCQTKMDYLRAFSSVGWGHPLYGMFNLSYLKKYNLELKFSEDLDYYMEGELLHHIFLTGKVKYVKDARILYSVDSKKPSFDMRIKNFLEYFRRTIQIYAFSELLEIEKREILNLIFTTYTYHLRDLVEKNASQRPIYLPRVKKAMKGFFKDKVD